MTPDPDYILVGGGLQNALILLALVHRVPSCKVTLLEQSATLGGNHTWSFHATDVAPKARPWFDPLVSARWPSYRCHFPRRPDLSIAIGYESILSSDLHRYVLQKASEHPHVRIEVGVAARDVHAGRVLLQDGRTLVADCVIDARGRSAATDCAGWQKFVGLDVELALASPGHRPLPCIMDATVPQQDGYRFFYTLPFTATRWLVEETFFSDSPELSVEEARPRILDYIENRLAARVVALHRVETGVLPMPWRSTPTADHGAFLAGYQGGWFHPATGYSLPVAVRLAEEIAKLYPLTPSAWTLAHFRRRHDRQTRFAHWLNAWLFRAFDPEKRWNVFERFYGLPLDTISRFYSLEMTLLDRARLFVGRPPEGISLSRFFARRPGR